VRASGSGRHASMRPCVLACVQVRRVRACIHGDPVQMWMGIQRACVGDLVHACTVGTQCVCVGIQHVHVCMGVRRVHGDPVGTDRSQCRV
jgi:hypothetical protein